jgi:hypothetical protein
LVGKPEGKRSLEDQDVGGWIILGWTIDGIIKNQIKTQQDATLKGTTQWCLWLELNMTGTKSVRSPVLLPNYLALFLSQKHVRARKNFNPNIVD